MTTPVKRPKGRPRTVKDPVDRSLRLSRAEWDQIKAAAEQFGAGEDSSWDDRVRAILREVEWL